MGTVMDATRSAIQAFTQIAVGGEPRFSLRALGRRVHVDAAERAVIGAEATADAMVFDDDRKVMRVPALRVRRTAMDGIDRAADETERVVTGATGAGNQILAMPLALEDQPGDAAVRFRASLDALLQRVPLRRDPKRYTWLDDSNKLRHLVL